MKTMDYDWSGRKVLVTGASGFKGSWLTAVLLKLGAHVAGTTRQHRNPLSSYDLLDIDKEMAKVRCDISDRQDVYDTINRFEPDVIFRLAAKALVPTALRDPRRTYAVNIAGTINIIEACRKLQLTSRILICSTDHVFGYIEPEDLPGGGFPEIGRVSYGGPYDTSKAAMELVVRSYHRTYWSELPGIGISRCANVFGPGDVNPRRVVPLFVMSSLDSKKVIPLRYRHNGRQFIHMVDAISGYVRAAASITEGGASDKRGKVAPKRKPFTQTFHFALEQYDGTSEPFIRMESLAEQVSAELGSSVDDSKCVDWAPKENKVQALNCDSTKKALGWSTQRTLKDGIRDLAAWYKTQGNPRAMRRLLQKEVGEILNAATK